MKKVLVAGATGYLGQYVVQEFANYGFHVRALARKVERLNQLANLIHEPFESNVVEPTSLLGCCDNMDIVFSSIGITKQKDGLTFMDVDYQGNMNLLQEAKKAGIKKFIYISVFNAHKLQQIKSVQAKLKFEQALKESGLNYSIIYPNGFFSDMQEYLHMAEKGRGFVFGSGENKINPIHGADLAKVCVEAAKKDDKEISVGGPEILSHNEILNSAFDILNKTAKISKIPLWIGKTFLALFKTFSSEKTYGPVEFFMTVLATDMVAPTYGQHRLKDYFMECKHSTDAQ